MSANSTHALITRHRLTQAIFCVGILVDVLLFTPALKNAVTFLESLLGKHDCWKVNRNLCSSLRVHFYIFVCKYIMSFWFDSDIFIKDILNIRSSVFCILCM